MKYTRLRVASLAIAAFTLAACKGDVAKDSLKNDSALAASLALANVDGAAKPQLTDTAFSPVTKAPAKNPKAKTKVAAPVPANPPLATPPLTPVPVATPAPAPTPVVSKPAAAIMGTVAAGTNIMLASNSRICTNTNVVGDNVTAETTESVSGSNGSAIPSGATVTMTVTQLKRSENAGGPVVMEFRITSISWGGHTYPVEASIASADVIRIRDEPKNKDVQKVAIGAVAGAIAGKILGKSNKGAVIGGAAGAAAGAATAAATANYQGCINQGAKIVIRLDAPLQLVVGAF